MKKLLSVVLMTAMLAATLASCAGGDTDTTTPAGNNAQTTTAGKTTPAVTPPPTETFPPDPDDEPTLPKVPGDGLEELIAGLTRVSDADSTVKVDMESLSSFGFSAWQDYESINELFDGIDTETEWFFDQDENGEYTILKPDADPENPDGTKRGGGPGKIGGPLNQNGIQGGYFYFALTDKATVAAYVITTGNDNINYPGRNPVEWTMYATNDQSVFEKYSIDGEEFNADDWVKLDYVYDGKVVEDNFYPNGYEIDAAVQGEYQYYVWYLGYTSDNVFQACELDLYIK